MFLSRRNGSTKLKPNYSTFNFSCATCAQSLLKLASTVWLPINAFLVASLYIPGIHGSGFSGRWAVASLSLFWLRGWPFFFAAYCFCILGFDHAMHSAITLGAFSWGMMSNASDRSVGVLAFSAGVVVSFVCAVPQYLIGWQGIYQSVPPAGLFVNKNILGEVSCLAIIALLSDWGFFSKRSIKKLIVFLTLILPLLILIIITGSRAVWLALLFSFSLHLPLRSRLLVLVILLSMVWFVFDHQSFDVRIMLWKTFDPKFFGNGDWDFSTLEYDAEGHMHNDWIQLTHELGVACLVPMFTIVFILAKNESSRAFIVALGTIGFFGFPLQMPATAWFAAFMLGTYLFDNPAQSRVSLFKSVRSISSERG